MKLPNPHSTSIIILILILLFYRFFTDYKIDLGTLNICMLYVGLKIIRQLEENKK